MSTETPETPVASTPPTPENVVEGETVPDPAELERLRAQVESLKARLSSAESVMRQALADPVHETRAHLLGLYLAAAQSAQDGGDDA